MDVIVPIEIGSFQKQCFTGEEEAGHERAVTGRSRRSEMSVGMPCAGCVVPTLGRFG